MFAASIGLAVNGMIKVTIKVHEHYVQTIVRLYSSNLLSYSEVSAVGASVPRDLFTGGDFHMEMISEDTSFDPFEHYLMGFVGYFEMVLCAKASGDGFDVESARYITKERGARDVTEAYQHPELGERMRQNLFDVLADKNVEKLNEMLGALADAWG